MLIGRIVSQHGHASVAMLAELVLAWFGEHRRNATMRPGNDAGWERIAVRVPHVRGLCASAPAPYYCGSGDFIMNRNRVVLLVVVALVARRRGAGPMSPAARVLEVKGKATVVETENFDRPAAIYGTIYADERLEVAKDAQVTLVFRSDGHVERVVAPGTFHVTQSGCQPQTGVQQVAMPEQNRAVVGKISKGPRGIVQGGVVMARAAAPPTSDNAPPQESELPLVAAPAKIRPIADSTLLAAKPVFSWPAVPKAKKYTLNLYFLGNRVWSAASETTRLEYSGETPLKSGAMYSWEVTTTIDGKPATVCEGVFHTASERQRAEAAALEKLLAKPEPLYLALAALWYKQNGLVPEAIAVNEQLAKLTPDAAVYRELAELYLQAGREDDANAARSQGHGVGEEGGRAEGRRAEVEVEAVGSEQIGRIDEPFVHSSCVVRSWFRPSSAFRLPPSALRLPLRSAAWRGASIGVICGARLLVAQRHAVDSRLENWAFDGCFVLRGPRAELGQRDHRRHG